MRVDVDGDDRAQRLELGAASASNVARSASKPASPCCTTLPLPCRRTIFGGPSKAANMTQMRPFSRRCATVSIPLPSRST